MDTTMAVSREKIRALREAKAWSQAHLAEAAGLSLRTVQRVEAEGSASAETRMAIAGALAVSVDDLNPAPAAPPAVEPAPVATTLPERAARGGRPDPGPLNTLLMLSTLGAALLFVLWLGGTLPTVVASHFGIAGEANSTMSRDGFVLSMLALMVGLPILVWTLLGWAIKWQWVKIPNAPYWFAEPRRPATERYLYRHFTWLAIAMTVFMGATFWLVARANASGSAHPTLDAMPIDVAIGLFVAVLAGWSTLLSARFTRKEA